MRCEALEVKADLRAQLLQARREHGAGHEERGVNTVIIAAAHEPRSFMGKPSKAA